MLVNTLDIAQLQDVGNKLLNLAINCSVSNKTFSQGFLQPAENPRLKQCLEEALVFANRKQHMLNFFSAFADAMRDGDTSKAFESYFADLFHTISQFSQYEDLRKITVALDDINDFEVSVLKHNIPNNASLENIVSLFKNNEDFFELVLIDGSLGSNDYIMGWSDVDIFAVIKDEVLCDVQQVQKLQEVIYAINREIYNYHLLQLHGVFYCFSSDFLFHRDKFFPLACLKEGRLIIRPNRPSIDFWECEIIIQNDAYIDFTTMRSDFIRLLSLKRKSSLTKTLIIHKLFLFPTFCLALKRTHCYKRESYDLLAEYEHEFPGIKNFCRKLKEIYHTISLGTGFSYHLRVLMTTFVSPVYGNRLACFCERKVVKGIKELYETIDGEGLFDQMNVYLSGGR